MGIVAKYKFNQTIYENFIPEFNSEFTNYTITDEIGTDGYTIRTIESNTLPTLMIFGQLWAVGETGATDKSLSLLEVYECDTSNITDMNSMFRYCTNLTLLDASNFDTSNVTIMQAMFTNCSSLISLNVSNFNTSKVTNMHTMFQNCSSLISLDLSNFDTSKVTTMYGMFQNCTLLTSLNLSNFNTSQVTSMEYMFTSCSSLTSLDLSNFNTSNVTTMYVMFFGCQSLTSLNISNFDTSKVTIIQGIFQNCSKLTLLDVSNFDTSKITDMRSMFYNCSSLTSLDVSNFDTSNAVNMEYMFYNCSSLTSLDLSNFNTSKVTDMACMFSDCSSLTSLNISNFNTEKVTGMSWIFSNCSSLTSLDILNFDTSKVTFIDAMFANCSKLTSLDVSNFDTSQATNMSHMFQGCSSLTSIDISSWNTNKVNNMQNMFFNCSSLISLDISNFDTSKVTNMIAMFNNCSSLSNVGMIYCNSDTINKISSSLSSISNAKIYYSLPNISELEPHDNVEYIKYIFPTTIQLPPHIQLHSLPDGTRDEVDIKTGILTRNVAYTKHAPKDLFGITTGFGRGIFYDDTTERWIGHQPSIDYTIFNSIGISNFQRKSVATAPISIYKVNSDWIGIAIKSAELTSKGYANTQEGFLDYVLNEEIMAMYPLSAPTTEQLILNYNNSCNYGVILPRGTSDNYNVITNEFKQNLDFIPIDGSIAFDTATLKDTTVKFSVTLSKFEVDITNVRGSDGIYCDNDLFKYEDSDNDYEHAYIENDTTLHIYVNKSRLSSYDQVGFQLYLSSNPFNVYYAMRTPIVSYVNYEDLDPEKASWEMLDCTEDGSITIESGNMDKTLLLDCLDYVAPTKNRFEIDLLKANTQYTVYAEGVSGIVQLNFGGNTVNFTSGNIYTSGETQLVEFYTDNEIKNLIIIEGDTRNETIEFFEGLKSSENVTVISTNAPFVFGKGGKIQ